MNKRVPIPNQIMHHIQQAPAITVWTAVDFLTIGDRTNIDKALQRMVTKGLLRRIDRGLYDQPIINTLTGKPTAPDYRKVIEAISRRDQARILIDGMTAANDLGWTNAVPAKVIVHTDARLRPIRLDKLLIEFKLTAPSKLYWAGRPAMRVVQALYWFGHHLKEPSFVDRELIKIKTLRLLQDPDQGIELQKDLLLGLHTMPSWMQEWLQELFVASQNSDPRN